MSGILVNTITISTSTGPVKFRGGSIILDATTQALIVAAGGRMALVTDPVMAAAAVAAQKMILKGASEIDVDDFMGAAFSASSNVYTSPERNVTGIGQVAVASLAAFTVAQTNRTFVKDDVVLLTKQAAPAANGPYVVGTVGGGTAPLTRPDWWPTGGVQPEGFMFNVSSLDTVWGFTTWKVSAAGLVGTNDPVLIPNVIKGHVALTTGSPSTVTVPTAATLPGAQAFCQNLTTQANPVKCVLTPSTSASSLLITGPNTVTDDIAYLIVNF